jgi:hypothetical protein
VTEGQGEGLDLTGVAREHRAPSAQRPWWLSAGGVAAGLALAAPAAVDGRWGSAAFWGCLAAVQVVLALAPPQVVLVLLDEGALHVRRGLRLRRVPWDDVAQVLVQGRWEDASTAVLRDGQRLRLAGLPREDADRLAAALERSRPDVPRRPEPSPRRVAPRPPAAPGQVPPEDLDWEGPLRRGPHR